MKTANKLCGASHNLFNAVRIVMRTLTSESPAVPLFLMFFSPHKGTCCQRLNQLIGRAETARAELGWGDGIERLQLDGWIHARVHLGCLQVGMTEPQRDFP